MRACLQKEPAIVNDWIHDIHTNDKNPSSDSPPRAVFSAAQSYGGSFQGLNSKEIMEMLMKSQEYNYCTSNTHKKNVNPQYIAIQTRHLEHFKLKIFSVSNNLLAIFYTWFLLDSHSSFNYFQQDDLLNLSHSHHIVRGLTFRNGAQNQNKMLMWNKWRNEIFMLTECKTILNKLEQQGELLWKENKISSPTQASEGLSYSRI